MKFVYSIDKEDWREFVCGIPEGNIFQTPEMAEVYEDTRGYEPIAIFALEDDEVRGLALASLIWNGRWPLKAFSSRCIVQGGPLCTRLSYASPLLDGLDGLVSRRSLYTEVRNLWEMPSQVPAYEASGYTFVPHLNYHLDLSQGEEAIWSGMSKGRRRGITKAEKAGLEFSELQNRSQLPMFYEMLEETYSEVGIPLADKSLFLAAYRHLRPLQEVKFFLCHHQGEPIACRALLIFRKTIYDWYAGFLRTHRTKRPNDFLVWNILKWGVKNEYEDFDFGGAGSPKEEYGPREFKRSFGGKLVEPGRFEKVYKPTLFSFSKKMLRFFRRLL